MMWFLWITLVLIPVHPAHSHKDSPGLLCTNDYLKTVSCSWTRPSLGFAKDCWISGVKTFWELGGKSVFITRNCTVKQHRNSSLGCSFVFESNTFSPYETMPVISLNCNGTQVENITNYMVQNYIKMHPPGAPQVNITANFTLMSWSVANPVSKYFGSTFDFELQIKQREHKWKDASNFPTNEQGLSFQAGDLKGHLEARVRVKPHNRDKSNWSDWSPTTSWRVLAEYSSPLYWSSYHGLVRWILIVLGLSLLLVVVLTLYKRNKIQCLLKEKPLPNPSKYFQTRHSVHQGNLKEWLNPNPGTQSFFVAPSCDQISHVVVCDDWNETLPSPSPTSCSTSPLLHFPKYPPSFSKNHRGIYNSSSQSNFSNVGYFISSSSGRSARTDPNPAYFIYHESFQKPSHIFDPLFSLCDPLTSFPEYESLKREPESPDSGFGIMKEDEMNEAQRDICREEQEGMTDQSSPLCFLQLHHPSCSQSSPSTPSALTQPCESQQADVSETDTSSSSAAQLVAGAICRSSSMPVEPFETGYLTLKELQMTFSNKSI